MDDTVSKKTIVVAGDVTMDWNLARSSTKAGSHGWSSEACTRACPQPGGAAMLTSLVRTVAENVPGWEVRGMDIPSQPECPHDDRFHHSYAMWSAFQYGVTPPMDREPAAWRVEQFLGLDRCRRVEPQAWQMVQEDPSTADVVVLDDANLGYRDKPELWPGAVSGVDARPWILLKVSQPVAQGPLWDHLLKHHSDRLIVVMSVNDLRLTQVQVSRELSWERTAQDLAWELVHNPLVNGLSRCAHVVASFNAAGAFLLSRQKPEGQSPEVRRPVGRLFFDPKVIEGQWEQNHPGGMIGYTTCLVAGIVCRLLLEPEGPDVGKGIQAGLAALRTLHLEGYGERGTKASGVDLRFPLQKVARKLASDRADFAVVEVQDPMLTQEQPANPGKPPKPAYWTILRDQYADNLAGVVTGIVAEGPEAVLKGVPFGQFGDLLTVDRREIESYRSIRTLVREYARQERPKRPLSIAVFGPPGSGKSFGVTQVANSLLPGQIKVIEDFNLSQFGSPDDLVDALHMVRDVGLSGKLPLVFWDEFDTPLGIQKLGWLRYFLAPMQDGSFREGQAIHPIGRSIFVFAGGTSHTMEAFGSGMADEEFRAAKGPDFVSRLKGYVNVLGPNPQRGGPSSQGGDDPFFVIRRAILLRSVLKRNAGHIFEKREGKETLRMDPGVLGAFLQTRVYRHGARSMEALVAMSTLAGRSSFERSSLPAEAQLDLHVDGLDFLALVQRMDLQGELLETLARSAHQLFWDSLLAKGFELGEKNDEVAKTNSTMKPFDRLSEEEKEQNRGNVRDIASKLEAAGYVMVPARSNEPPFNFPGADLELLAQMEHDRWMKAKIASGCRYAEQTDKSKKLHACLLPWWEASEEELAKIYTAEELEAMGRKELPEDEKQKDRDLVLGIPAILRQAGYAVVKIRETARPRLSVRLRQPAK